MSPVLAPPLRRSGTYAAILLIGAAALAGCSSSPPHKGGTLPPSTTGTTSKSTTSSSGSTQTSGVSSKGTVPKGSLPQNIPTTLPVAGGAVGPTCTKSQLTISQNSSTPKGSALIGGYTIVNKSNVRCSLDGYPVVLLIGSLGPLPSHVTDGGVAGQKPLVAAQVTLAPRTGRASLLMSWTPVASAAAPTCADGLQVDFTLPGVTGGITAPSIVTACGGLLNVSPIQPNVVTPT